MTSPEGREPESEAPGPATPAPEPDPGPDPGPEGPGKPARETMWVAVGALAAVVAALIALLGYVTPRGNPAPVAVTTPAAGYSTPAPPTTPAPVLASIEAGPPAGCSDAFTAITTYNQTAGSTTDSHASAATQAYDSLLPDSTEATGAVSSDITDVAEDFYLMGQIETGQAAGSYSAEVAQANSDIQSLKTACG